MDAQRRASKSNAELDVSDNALTLAKVDFGYRLSRLIVIGLFACLSILSAGYALRPFAGQQTVISLFFTFLADIKFALAVTLAGSACAWAVAERLLRRQKTEQLQGRIVDLEKSIDPERTSSELTTQGTTNLRDR